MMHGINSMAKKYHETFASVTKSRLICFSLIYLTTIAFTEVSGQTQGLTLKLPQGEVTGTFETYRKNNDEYTYSVFRGIPYAKPPVGPLRLKEPEKHEGWSETYDASKFRPECPQWEAGNLFGDEDCLHINVYTPMTKVDSTSPTSYPVMVFIHGGKFQTGSSKPYHQQRFIDSQVILVTFNYRLGILGFLSTGDDVCPGNLGLKDQVLALEWIRDNIRHFGGNASSVTLFGQGAGAVSVFLHILSPKSRGLFHQAITQSGSPFCDWTLEESPRNYAEEVARRLGCSIKSSSAIVDCIRKKTYKKVIEVQKDNKTFGDYPLRAIPVIERGGFLPDSPAKLLESGDFKPIPLISGINKDDGAILYPLIKSYEDELKKNSSFLLKRLIPMFLLTATDIRGNIESVAQAVYFQYFNGIDPKNITQILQPFVNVSTDAMFVSCNYKTLESYSAKGAPVYMYTFEYKGQYSMLGRNEGKEFNYEGVSHGDELLYLFDMADIQFTEPYDQQKKMQMTYLWVTFAKKGAFPLTANAEYPIWYPYNNETKYYYKIDQPISRQSFYRQREIDFWLKHLTALAKIIPPSDLSNAKYEIGGFGWTMFAIALILLIILIVGAVILVKRSRSQYITTKSEDK